MTKFKAKPKRIPSWTHGEYDDLEWMKDISDEEGYVYGYYVDGFIVGGVVDTSSEYIDLDYWIPVDIRTLTPVEENKDES